MSKFAYICTELVKSKMLVNARLSNQVASRVRCSMSHSWHMERSELFAKRSHIAS
jgi:hypothetical protein